MKAIAIITLLFSAALPVLKDKDLPVTFAHTCNTKCFALVGSDKPLDCDLVRYNLDRALDAFNHHGPIRAPGACAAVKKTIVRIREEDYFWGDDVYGGGVCRGVSGMFHRADNYVEVTRSMHALAHEMLHTYEITTGLVDEPGELPGSWADNVDYIRMLQEYEETEIGLDGALTIPEEP